MLMVKLPSSSLPAAVDYFCQPAAYPSRIKGWNARYNPWPTSRADEVPDHDTHDEAGEPDSCESDKEDERGHGWKGRSQKSEVRSQKWDTGTI